MADLKDDYPGTSVCSCSSNILGSNKHLIGDTYSVGEKWITGRVSTPAGNVQQVSTHLSFEDTLGSWKARWGIGRMNFRVEPGLYCVGTPDSNSPVLVTANYKMSFDRLRKELTGLNAWILVLETRGINVWCAAGKGTFGTKELIRSIHKTNLSSILTKKILILPQLGAPGIAAHEVQRRTGFNVVYGPVRAVDIKAFISSGMVATEEMRTVKFNFIDRLVLTPMEIVHSMRISLVVFGILFFLNSIGFGSYGYIDLYAYLGAVITGCILTPVLLPWIPGKAFSFKGALLGFLWTAAVITLNWSTNSTIYDYSKTLAYILILPAISAYGAMNFTGCSTYTSLSGVDHEMKIALPSMIIPTVLGIVSLLIGSIIGLVL